MISCHLAANMFVQMYRLYLDMINTNRIKYMENSTYL